MREIKYLVLHCTATQQNSTIASIQKYWRESLGWTNPGYHYIIEPNGVITNLQPIEKIANGVAGYNTNSIHISYIGGVDPRGKALDNRTPEQKQSQVKVLLELKQKFPAAEIKGHRDFIGVAKACPSFEVRTWLQEIKFDSLLSSERTINAWAWFTDRRNTFGIVIITNEARERKAFIGHLKGNDNCFEDLKFIADNGAKFSLSAAEIAVREQGTVRDVLYKDLMP
jgi:N-acetylmuramoyl-L-alanine amidase